VHPVPSTPYRPRRTEPFGVHEVGYQRLYRADVGSVEQLPVPPDGPTACVWELLAIDHERRAWVEYVLSDPVDPDLGAYLAAGLVVYG
jgi:hypothetical protein